MSRTRLPVLRNRRHVVAVVAVGVSLAVPVLAGFATANPAAGPTPTAPTGRPGAPPMPDHLVPLAVSPLAVTPVTPVTPATAADSAAGRPAVAPAPATPSSAATRASRDQTRTALPPTPSYATRTAPRAKAATGSPKATAQALLARRGWSGQFGCLDALWAKESGWKVDAANPSGAYGIPQALPGSKMAAAGPGWRTDPATQIAWGLDYIAGSYGSPCAAWSHSQASNWY